jgi:hypothetical protein
VGANGVLYHVGAKLSYTLNGVPTTIDVSPDSIRVKPMPMLTLDYFLPGDVYGDDPFTTELEFPIPFSLGVRVRNTGAGIARNLQIESGQPKIIDNQQGLAVSFKIEGSEVNGAAASSSLLADFGDIAPDTAGMARWIMTSSLDGRFTDFTASFSHDDELGGQLTSLISEVRTHELIQDVRVDLPGRDGIRDFLAWDNGVISVYESDHADGTVMNLEETSWIEPNGRTFRVGIGDVSVPGFSYVKVPDPLLGGKAIFSVVRSDGKVLHRDNSWLSSTYVLETESREHSINIFDTNNPGHFSYTVTMGSPTGINHPPVIAQTLPHFTAPGVPISIPISARDPDGDEISITHGPLPAGAAFTTSAGGTGRLTWTPDASQLGIRAIEFTVSDGELTDRRTVVVGVFPAGGAWENWKNLFWPGVTDPAVVGPGMDPDGDGFVNLTEYMFGMDPTSGTLFNQPEQTTVMVDGRPYLAILFTSRKDANFKIEGLATSGATGMKGGWQVCRNTVAQDQGKVASGFERILIRDNVPMDAEKNRFMRLRVAVASDFPNHAPVVLAMSPRSFPAGVPLTVDVSASDPDGDFLTLGTGALPGGAQFSTTALPAGKGTIKWTPRPDQVGSHTIQISTSDGALSAQKPFNLTITAASLLAAWQASMWPGVDNPGITGTRADPDNDGYANILEYALGMNPVSGKIVGQPLVTTVVEDGKRYLAIVFIGRVNDSELSILVEAAGGLSDASSAWQVQQTRIPQNQTDVPAGFEKIMIRDSVPVTSSAKRFMRLKVAR